MYTAAAIYLAGKLRLRGRTRTAFLVTAGIAAGLVMLAKCGNGSGPHP